MSIIDNMIEEWAKSRSASVRESVDAPLEGLEGFSLTQTPATPLDATQAVREAVAAKKATLRGVSLDAAHAVREAVLAKGGRRPKVDYWKPVAAKALGISRLFQKRWEAVLDAGVEAGLFRIDSDTLSHPILVALDPEPVSITHEPEITESEIVPERPKRRTTTEIISDLSSTLPDGWVAPVTLPCGHMNWPHNGLTPDAPTQTAAREAGFCCARVHEATVETRRLNPGTKRSAPVQINWQVRGLHEPVPERLRRSPERDMTQGGLGWAGFCTHPETGLYIGGIGNDCRREKGKVRCLGHARK